MSLERILNAESVAIVGASKNVNKRGYQAIKTLMEEKYEGKIYPVNPKEKSILGYRCFENVSAIEDPVDIALITTPARTIPAILDDCGKKGVAGAVIIAGGFREVGSEGISLENQLVEAALKNNIRVIGPNTSGMMNLKTRLNLVGLRDAPVGNIALISQSGNMALTLINEAKVRCGKGFSYYVGVGNETDLKFHEYLEYFREDPDTRAILMYVEGLRDGRSFLQEAYRTTLTKPIILLKSGRSTTGKKSAGSHTGAIAGISEVARVAFLRAGIIVIENSDELFPVAEALSTLPPIKGNTVGILADGGGHATIASDLLSDMGVEIPELEEKTRAKLKEILPFTASVRNPVDVAGGTDEDPSIFAECAKIMLKDHHIGGLLIVGLFGGYGIRFADNLSLAEEDAAHRMGKMVRKRKKPIVVHSLYAVQNTHPLELLRYYDIPVFDSLDISCKCTSVLAHYGRYLKSYHAKTNFVLNCGKKSQFEGRKMIQTAREEGRRVLLEHEAKKLFKIHGARGSRDLLATTAEEAVQAGSSFHESVALKIVSPDIVHKSDAGGVQLNLVTDEEIRTAFERIMHNARSFKADADIRGVLVCPMEKKQVEVIIGTKIDEQFGPVIMFGLGGIMVEILKDVTFRVLPITALTARRMMEDIRAYPLLKGIRGLPSCDIKGLRKLLLICSEIVEAYPEIEEIDLNPVLVHEDGYYLADARIILTEKGKSNVDMCY